MQKFHVNFLSQIPAPTINLIKKNGKTIFLLYLYIFLIIVYY